MTTPPSFSKKNLQVDDRNFVIQVIKFENGNFVAISENVEKLGSMVVSLGTGPTPVTTTIIPPKTDSLFLKLIAERISTNIKGIAIVSSFFNKELDANTAKSLMEKTMEIVRNV